MGCNVIAATVMREHGETGVQTHINVVTDYLRGQGRPAKVVTPFDYLFPVAAPVYAVRRAIDPRDGTFSVWWYRYWHYVFLKQALLRALRNEPDDVVICAHCPPSALAALRARGTRRRKVFMVMHYDISQAEEWAIRGKIERGGALYRSIQRLESTVLPRLDGIVYVSQFMRRVTLDTIPEAAGVPWIVMPNFLPPGHAAPNGGEQVSGDLINIGTLEPRKNQSYLLRVLAEAKKLGKSYTLTLVGDGEHRTMLRELARTLGVEEQVRFMGFQPKAARFLPSHRAYVHSSILESSPIALIEALSCGKPLFAGQVGGIPEMFDDGIEGTFWPLDDPVEGARRLIALLEDPQRLEAMSRAARRKFEQAYSSDVLARRLVHFMCAERPAGPAPARELVAVP